ncbi:DnaJ domain-containing protein, partial [Patescibacteria group bacterium]|nr:DnaJ domain-containing protein [Patescibacteria group bacterium]
VLEIKDAYYKLAKQYHPDKYEYKKDQAVLEETTKKMKDITAANEILNAYCKYHFSSLSLEKNQSYSLGKIDVENSIVVKE